MQSLVSETPRCPTYSKKQSVVMLTRVPGATFLDENLLSQAECGRLKNRKAEGTELVSNPFSTLNQCSFRKDSRISVFFINSQDEIKCTIFKSLQFQKEVLWIPV